MKVGNSQVEKQTGIKPSKIEMNRVFFTEKESYPFGDLIEVQKDSFADFIKNGIGELIDEISPILDFSEKKLELKILNYEIEDPKISSKRARTRNASYESVIKARVSLLNKENGEIKEQSVIIGTIPQMTDKGTFIVNGIERVVVNQLVRSPGIFFSKSLTVFGKFNVKFIPKRGAWLEIETDKKGVLYGKIDRKRKFPITQFLRVFGMSDKEMIKEFAVKGVGVESDNIHLTLEKDSGNSFADSCQSIYKKIKPGDLATVEKAKEYLDELFLDFTKYDTGLISRYKTNKRFGLKKPETKEFRTFQIDELKITLKELIRLNTEGGKGDDIDHLSNRRIRSVGELIHSKFRIGLVRMERIIKDRMTVIEPDKLTPMQLINHRPVTAILREFFVGSQLSQFMDQTNPLSELGHKRRISAMGPGGLSRERASFEVRDVHPSHYGRVCPIATPEGPNIGLVLHFANYGKVNKYGFIKTPFREVSHTVSNGKEAIGKALLEDTDSIKKGTILDEKSIKKIKGKTINVKPYLTDKVKYYDSAEEKDLIIAQANSILDENGNFINENIAVRKNGEPLFMHAEEITHIDISPKQIISESTSLIPFLEHNDNTRASMGTNMLRQAVPLAYPESPVVGTGMEGIIGKAIGQSIYAKDDGKVVSADGRNIEIIYKDGKKEIHELDNYIRSNQGTSVHTKSKVIPGQELKKGDVIADGTSIQNGELALGRNLLVAYASWKGYNFEDAIIISERVTGGSFYDSIHIKEYVADIRDTKLGVEITTRDIPNVGDARLKDLDEDGIIRIGATVKEGDILVGKITPKGESEQTPEERLLQAIFGEKAKDVKDSSLKLGGGEGGKVVSVQTFSKQQGDELNVGILKQIRVFVAQTRKLQVGDKMAGRHGNKGVVSKIVPVEDMPFLEDGTPIDVILNPLGVSSRMNIGQILETHLGWAAKILGFKVATPPLNGIKGDVISSMMKKAGIPQDGKVQLFDGETGEAFLNKTTVGIKYVLKLHHLVEDKIHARSVGPYSLVTQQPLGGKAQNGGQRFGEMEVWALEGYGAAYTLQEMLTIKADDVQGRARAYEDIVKGQAIRKPSVPESFNVLVHELQALCLNVHLKDSSGGNLDIKEIISDGKEGIEESSKISDLNEEIKEDDKIAEKEVVEGFEEGALSMEDEIKKTERSDNIVDNNNIEEEEEKEEEEEEENKDS